MKFRKSYWKLSEDPNDRKDGLWVWGLFKEPLYPFMLLQLETERIPLSTAGRANEEETVDTADFIPPLQLYAQINHQRDNNIGVVLAGGSQQGTVELKVRLMETVAADVFGAAKVDIYDEVSVGSLSVQPLIGKSLG